MRSNRQPLGKAVDIAYNEIINNKAVLGNFIDTEFLSPQLVCELINKSILEDYPLGLRESESFGVGCVLLEIDKRGGSISTANPSFSLSATTSQN